MFTIWMKKKGTDNWIRHTSCPTKAIAQDRASMIDSSYTVKVLPVGYLPGGEFPAKRDSFQMECKSQELLNLIFVNN